MARTAYSRNSYDGGASQASLSVAVDSSTTTIVLANTNNSWDSLGATYGFWLSLDYGNQTEEKLYVPAQGSAPTWSSGTVTLTNVVRGADSTTAVAHAAAAPAVVVMTATDLNEANYAVSQTVGSVTAQGDILYGAGANALAVLAAGTAGKVLTSNGPSAAPTWTDQSNVWSGSTSYTVSGFANYLVIADVTCTQPSASPAGGSFSLTSGSKSVSAYLGATVSATATATLVYVNSSGGTITASATKGGGLPAGATLSAISLTVIGLN